MTSSHLADRSVPRAWHVAAGGRATSRCLASFEAEGPGRTSRGLARYSSLAADPAASRDDAASAVLGRAAGLLVGRTDPVRARRVAEAGYRAYPDLRAGADALMLAALCDLLLGDVRSAVRRLGETTTPRSPTAAVVASGIEASARLRLGELEAAHRCAAEAAELRDRHPAPGVPVWVGFGLDLITVSLGAASAVPSTEAAVLTLPTGLQPP